MAPNSFKARMKAWWEGYDLPAEPARNRSKRPHDRPRLTRKCRHSAEAETVGMIFGEGRNQPLGVDPFEGIAKPGSGDSEQHVLLIGAETGGTAIHLATNYNLFVTALEPDRRSVRVAEDLAGDVDGSKRFHFSPVDLINVELNQSRYDLMASRLLLHRYRARDLIYRKMERALRKKGTLSLVQFVAAEDADVATLNGAMVSSVEPEVPFLLSQEDEKRMLIESGLRPDTMIDITAEVVSQLGDTFSRWQELTEQIAEFDQQPRMLQSMLAQVQHWQSRINLLNSGDLQVVQFRSVKKPSELI